MRRSEVKSAPAVVSARSAHFVHSFPAFVHTFLADRAHHARTDVPTHRQGWRYVPGAQIFAQCAAGDGTNSLVGFKARAKHGVAPGKIVRYMAKVKNLDKSAAVEGLALTVQLPPAGVTYLSSKSSSAYIIAQGKAGKVKYANAHRGLPVTVNYTSTPQFVTWHNLALPPRKGMKFALQVRVNSQGVYRGMPLVFTASVYQELPVNGLPYCSSAYTNTTVLVK